MDRELSGPEKAAVLFLTLGEELAEQIFNNLDRREMRLLASASREVGTLEGEDVETCLNDFVCRLRTVMPELRGGAEFMSRLAAKSLGAARAKEFLGETNTGLFDVLADLDTRTIVSLIGKEHPQTVALILGHLPAERGAEVLADLPETMQSDVIHRLARIDQVSPQVVELVEEALHTELARMGKGLTQKVGGVNLVADIMNNLDKAREQTLMVQVEEKDEELAEEVRGLMFVFDDLIHVDGRGIQTLLKEVERESLVLALKAADDALKDHIFKNLSGRAAEMIADDMEQRGPVRLSEVEKAQSEVVKVALQLSQSGQIEVAKGGDDELV